MSTRQRRASSAARSKNPKALAVANQRPASSGVAAIRSSRISRGLLSGYFFMIARQVARWIPARLACKAKRS
jgi:hypothetical protein